MIRPKQISENEELGENRCFFHLIQKFTKLHKIADFIG